MVRVDVEPKMAEVLRFTARSRAAVDLGGIHSILVVPLRKD